MLPNGATPNTQFPHPPSPGMRGNPGRTIYTAHLPYSIANTANTAGKQPSPISSAFGSENAAPVFANDFEWNTFSREPNCSFESFEFEEIPQPERTPLGNTSNFPSNILGSANSANVSVDSAVSDLHFAIGFAGYGQSSGLIFEEPLLNGSLEPRYMGHRMPESCAVREKCEGGGIVEVRRTALASRSSNHRQRRLRARYRMLSITMA